MANAPLILVDGSSYLYRAFFASQQADMRTADGFPTGAIRVMTSMLRSLIKLHPDSPVAVVFDAKGKTFRDEIYSEYKAHRPAMPDDLRQQVEPIHDMVRALGLPLLMEEGVEADDVIGTLARQASEAGIPVIISTGDKDMAQLVDEHVLLMDTMKNSTTDRQAVKEKFGVWPEQIIDYLALVGDSADNIPGVPKCGPKTAAKWLEEHQTLDSLIANAEAIKGKIGDNLRASLSQLEMARELATIKTDVTLELTPGVIDKPQPNNTALLELFTRFQFRSWVSELSGEATEETAPASESIARHYETLLDWQSFERWLERLNNAELFSFDTETTSLDYMDAQIVGVSFAIEAGEAAYLPLAHDYVGAPSQLDRSEALARLKPLLEDPAHLKVGQHLKYDMNVLANYGIELRGIAFDTMLESYALNSTATRHDMDSLANHYLNEQTVSFEAIAGKGKKQLTFNQIDLEQAAPYAAEDADITLRLHQALRPQLEQTARQATLHDELERPLIPVLSQMERTGALVDPTRLAQQSHELSTRLAELEQQAHEQAGKAFNLSSPKQLQEILFDEQKLPVVKKTPKGAPSTAEEVLVELAEDYPLPRLILEHRSLSKLKSTYTDKLPTMINPRTGRIHTSYHQAVTATGRLSSTDPNLQNIPIRTAEGRRVRQAFIAPEGYTLVAADYSQIELRIMAHLSADEGLLNAFSSGADIHRATAAEVFKLALDAVTDEQRRSAKAINFGLIYGMSAFGLAKQLGVGRHEAAAYMDHYFETYPGVRDYMDRIRTEAKELGYVETLRGRRLYLPEINSRNGMRRQAAERTAINAPMQGSAADIIKQAMLNVSAWLAESEFDAHMLMQVHDELVFEVRTEQRDDFIAGLKPQMESAADLAIPLLVEIGCGSNWDEAH